MPVRSALILATTKYADPGLLPLAAPEADATVLSELLRHQDIGAFEVTSLVNRTNAEVNVAIATFFQDRAPDDFLLLYFSGHGVPDAYGNLYLAHTDTLKRLISATATSAEFIRQAMAASGSRRQVLVLDCCYSGAFARSKSAADLARDFGGDGSARVILTATSADKRAWEGNVALKDTKLSLFTHFLAKGLETGAADADGDGIITVEELFHYTDRSIRRLAIDQHPQMSLLQQSGQLHIAKNRAPAPKRDEISHEVRREVRSPKIGERLNAAMELEMLLAHPHRGLALAAQELLEELTCDDSHRVREYASRALAKNLPSDESLLSSAGEARTEDRLQQANAFRASSRSAPIAPPPSDAYSASPPARDGRLREVSVDGTTGPNGTTGSSIGSPLGTSTPGDRRTAHKEGGESVGATAAQLGPPVRQRGAALTNQADDVRSSPRGAPDVNPKPDGPLTLNQRRGGASEREQSKALVPEISEADDVQLPQRNTVLWSFLLVLLVGVVGVLVAPFLRGSGGKSDGSGAASSSPKPDIRQPPAAPDAIVSRVEVVVRTDVEGGELFVDGESYGTATEGEWLLELPPGPHRLEARAGGNTITSALVNVREGVPATVFLELPEGASLVEPASKEVKAKGKGTPTVVKTSAYSASELASVVASNQVQLKRCYETALGAAGGIQEGAIELRVNVVIGTNGTPKRVTARGDGLGNMKDCICSAVRRWRFPQGAVESSFEFPVVFQQRGPFEVEASQNADSFRNANSSAPAVEAF